MCSVEAPRYTKLI